MPLKNASTVQRVMHINILSAGTKSRSDRAMSQQLCHSLSINMQGISIQVHFYGVIVANCEKRDTVLSHLILSPISLCCSFLLILYLLFMYLVIGLHLYIHTYHTQSMYGFKDFHDHHLSAVR